MLAEERAENERLRQIILAMQRHRFGRRAESLPEDQLLLGLEEAEQVEAAGFAGRGDRARQEGGPEGQAAHEPWGAAGPPAAGRDAWSTSRAPPARAARVPCTGSARTCPSASTWCRRSSGCW